MVIVESTISHRVFADQMEGHHVDIEKITFGLGKAGAVVMFAYFFLKLQGVIDNHALGEIGKGFYGKWWLVEMLGFVLLPSLLYAWGARNRRIQVVRFAAILGVLGIVLNRLNVSLVAYNYNQPVRYWPSWMEVAVSLTLVVIGVLAFRWIVLRMPVLHPMKGHASAHGETP
jgi:Ni/Fe-hydrogenase subunit HybB-like protein